MLPLLRKCAPSGSPSGLHLPTSELFSVFLSGRIIAPIMGAHGRSERSSRSKNGEA